jgi:hypothetical protein
MHCIFMSFGWLEKDSQEAARTSQLTPNEAA